jgi:hypothetical protein
MTLTAVHDLRYGRCPNCRKDTRLYVRLVDDAGEPIYWCCAGCLARERAKR